MSSGNSRVQFTHQEMWLLSWAMPKLSWFQCSKPVAQISPVLTMQHSQYVLLVVGWKGCRPREMFSSLLYRNLCVSNTAATNCTYPKIRYAQLEKVGSRSCWSVASQKQRNWQHCAFTSWNYTVCPQPKTTGIRASTGLADAAHLNQQAINTCV